MNNELKESYVTFDTAKLLKGKGFGCECIKKYNERGRLSRYTQFSENYNKEESVTDISAPTISLAKKWIYENFKIYVESFMDDNGTFGYFVSRITEEGRIDSPIQREFSCSGKAENEGLLYVLKNKI